MKHIDFTLLVPVWNTKPAHLFECFESIEAQTVPHNFPIIISDDGSTDAGTLKAIEQLVKRNSMIRVIRSEVNLGTSNALNLGHDAAETEYIALSGSQDLSHPTRFEKQIRYLEKNPNLDVLGAQIFSFKDSDPLRKPIFTSSHPRKWDKFPVNGWATNHGTVFYKNESVKRAGYYDLAFRRAQDIQMWRQMNAKGMTIENLPDVLCAWRKD